MKKTTISLLLTLLLTVPGYSAEQVEAIVARVGDRIITRSQYDARLREGFAELERTVPPQELTTRKQDLKRNLINEMLSELLIKDRADRIGLTVSPNEVKEAVDRLKAQYGIESDEKFNESLKGSGLTRPEMEGRLRDTLLTNKVFSRELRSRQDLSDKELRERYEREKEQYRLPERARLREIVLVVPEGADQSAAEALSQKAQTIAESAKASSDFAALAKESSDSPSKEQGGEIGVVSRGEMQPALDVAVFNATAGSVVGPIQGRSGFHIVKVEERLPSEIPSFDSIKERLRREADEETFQRDYKSYIERLRKEAFVQVYEDRLG